MGTEDEFSKHWEVLCATGGNKVSVVLVNSFAFMDLNSICSILFNRLRRNDWSVISCSAVCMSSDRVSPTGSM